MTIAEILAAHDTLCMDAAADRATLADALRLGLYEAMDELVNADETPAHQVTGIVAARDFIQDMDEQPGPARN